MAMIGKKGLLGKAARVCVGATRGEGTSCAQEVQRRDDTRNFFESCVTFAKCGNAINQPARVRMLWGVEHAVGGGFFDDAACIHDGDSVGHLGNSAHVVGDKDDGCAELALDFIEQIKDLGLHRHVERCCRLVGYEHLWTARDSHRDHHTLTHPTRKLMRVIARALGGRDIPLDIYSCS